MSKKLLTQFNVKASDEEIRAFKQLAKDRHLTLSALIRILLHSELKSSQEKVA